MGRESATQARAVALYQEKAARMDQLSSDTSDAESGQGRCLAMVYALKKLLLDVLLEEASKIFDFPVVVVLREVAASHEAFREWCEEKPGRRRSDFVVHGRLAQQRPLNGHFGRALGRASRRAAAASQ